MRGGKISSILYAYMAGGVVSFSVKQIFLLQQERAKSKILLRSWLLMRWFRQPVLIPELSILPSSNIYNGVEKIQITSVPLAQIVRDRGHG